MKNKNIIIGLVILIVIILVGGFFVHQMNLKKAEKVKIEAEKKMEEKLKVEAAKHLTAGLIGSENTVVREGEPYMENGAFCIDDRYGAVKDYNIRGKVDTSKPGNYEISYDFVSDDAEKTVKRSVKVIPKDKFKANEDGVAVLMYHYVYTDQDFPENINGNYIKDTDLEAQLQYLTENNYYFPGFAELRAYVDGKISLPENSVILTFDDGQYGFLNYGIPLLDKYKIPSTAFLIGVNEGERKLMNYHSSYVNYQNHSYDMHHGGGTIGHGGIISAMTKKEIIADLQKNMNLTGTDDAFAYPYGDVTDDAETALREVEILCSFTTENRKIHIGDSFTRLPRVRVQGTASLTEYIAGL